MSAHADAIALLGAWTAGDRSQDRLRREFALFLQDHPDGVDRSCTAGHLTASALVVDPPGRRVLLTRHATVGRWLQLGGHIEPTDVSVSAAARREAREESGIADLALSPSPVRLDRHAVQCRNDETVTELDHLDVQFVAVAPPGAQPVAEASAPLAWFDWDDLPADADEALRALVAVTRTRFAV